MMLNVTSLTWEPATRQDSGCDSAHAQQQPLPGLHLARPANQRWRSFYSIPNMDRRGPRDRGRDNKRHNDVTDNKRLLAILPIKISIKHAYVILKV